MVISNRSKNGILPIKSFFSSRNSYNIIKLKNALLSLKSCFFFVIIKFTYFEMWKKYTEVFIAQIINNIMNTDVRPGYNVYN